MADKARKVVVAPFPRTMSEIFAAADLERLQGVADVVWARDEELTGVELAALLSDAWAYVGFQPTLSAAQLAGAPQLQAVLEVGGHFPAGLDYRSCFERGIRVMSCAPAFGRQVAEMSLALTLAACRGVVRAHLDMQHGREEWQGDATSDFTLYGATLGFVGFGSIARELLALLRPFGCAIKVFDPWLPDTIIRAAGCVPASLEEVMAGSRAVYVLAPPTPENEALISARLIATMQPGALLAVISRAHLVDFDAVVAAAEAGRIQAAIDVFPAEPMPAGAAVRRSRNIVLSPHRAASIRRERQAIGRMVVDDLELMARGLSPMVMQTAQPELIRRRLEPRPAAARTA